jgi:hypothetical protein
MPVLHPQLRCFSSNFEVLMGSTADSTEDGGAQGDKR